MSHPSGDLHWTRAQPERIKRGPDHHAAKLSAEQIEGMIAYYAKVRPSQAWVARMLGVSRQTVWRHLKAAGLV